MKDVTCVILGAGNSTRFGNETNKIYQLLNGKTVLEHSIDKFLSIEMIKKIIVVFNSNDYLMIKGIIDKYDNLVTFITGGINRSESLKCAKHFIDTDYLIVHDAARPYTNIVDIRKLIESLKTKDVVTLYKESVDAVKVNGHHVPKCNVFLTSTPQGFSKDAYMHLFNSNINREDDIEPFEETSYKIGYIKETTPNTKITYDYDLDNLSYRVGYSMDFHPFCEQRALILGGISIPNDLGLLGHSDADVVLHALTESILGALNLNDIGDNYPDNDPKYKDISSVVLLNDVLSKMNSKGYSIGNVDIMIYLEKQKLKEYKLKIQENISKLLNVDSSKISVKATTMEKKGFIGTSEGIASEACVLLTKCK